MTTNTAETDISAELGDKYVIGVGQYATFSSTDYRT